MNCRSSASTATATSTALARWARVVGISSLTRPTLRSCPIVDGSIRPPIGQESYAGQRQAGIEEGPLLDAWMRRIDQISQQVGQTIARIVLRVQAALASQPQLLQQG